MRPSIRLSAILWLAGLLVLLVFVGSRIITFAHIFYNHSGIALTQVETARAHNATTPDPRPQLIPKIVHQVFHNWHDPGNDTLPTDWQKVRKTCIDKNPDFEVKLWTEKASRDFIETEYAWFLNTYDSYPFPVQRVDAVRYFLLLHYGGIYLDLDNGCMGDLTPLLYYPMWITDGGRGALSNNVLASRPHHPYWALLTQSLYDWNYNYFFPYVTISYASGQWFETAIWEKYHSMLPRANPRDAGVPDPRLHRLIMDDRPGMDTWLYFTQERGGTWKNWDNRLFLLLGDHLILFLLAGAGLGAGAWWLAAKVVRKLRGGYTRLKEGGQPGRYMV